MQFITLSGFKGSGKSEASRYLQSKHGYIRLSFADTIKDIVSIYFGWDRELLSGDTVTSRKFRETVDTWWSEKLGIPDLTPRYVLQHWGTELFRDNVSENVWVYSLLRKAETLPSDSKIVIDDCRFNNEFLHLPDATKIWIQRLPYPSWYVSPHDTYPDVHRSEWEWLSQPFHYQVSNNDAVHDLHRALDNIIQK